jgi:hypothetical protein
MAYCKICKSLGPTIPVAPCTFVSDQSSYYEATHKQTTDTSALSVCIYNVWFGAVVVITSLSEDGWLGRRENGLERNL